MSSLTLCITLIPVRRTTSHFILRAKSVIELVFHIEYHRQTGADYEQVIGVAYSYEETHRTTPRAEESD